MSALRVALRNADIARSSPLADPIHSPPMGFRRVCGDDGPVPAQQARAALRLRCAGVLPPGTVHPSPGPFTFKSGPAPATQPTGRSLTSSSPQVDYPTRWPRVFHDIFAGLQAGPHATGAGARHSDSSHLPQSCSRPGGVPAVRLIADFLCRFLTALHDDCISLEFGIRDTHRQARECISPPAAQAAVSALPGQPRTPWPCPSAAGLCPRQGCDEGGLRRHPR